MNVQDPDAGWCDEIRRLTITRCDLPTNVILLNYPGALETITLEKENLEEEILFTWDCKTNVEDYSLWISFNKDFEEPLQFICGSEKSYSFTHEELDELLAQQGVGRGKEITIYWQVTATGNTNNPIENSAVRESAIQRFLPDAVKIELKEPADGSDVELAVENSEEMISFTWDCDTTGVSFQVHLFDYELEASYTFDAGEENSFSVSQLDLDFILEQTFEMVASQKKKIYWEVLSSDETIAISSDTVMFTARRFLAVLNTQPINLINGPADGATYILDYQSSQQVISTVTWDCTAPNIIYVLEYSLSDDMSNSKVTELTKNKSVDFTHQLLDNMLSDLGGSYLTKTIYWRITSSVTVMTEPSEIRSMNLTGMLRPFTDYRNRNNPETYEVVKIGNNFWMAENLRATIYSDGSAFTTVDVPSKSYEGEPVYNTAITGQYYTWPTAVRNMELAGTSETTIIQEVCPDGWHISTVQDWEDLISDLSATPAMEVKSTSYWANTWGITNSSGLNIVPSGVFWHNNLQVPDNGTNKASFWTTTLEAEKTAFMYELFDWEQTIIPWAYPNRPWSEGDATASRLTTVRCVRDYN
ncbi:MAG: SusE domain-containing protein [Tannerellaceae bacterium]|nr:SusE domain-containing protein [Tannerellaceae bacterium]